MYSPLVKVGCVAVAVMLLSALAFAQRPARHAATPAASATGDNVAASDYALNCAGCHGLDGSGDPEAGIPDFRRSIGLFTRTTEGRAYLIRVPGSADALLTDARLAAVLNWIVMSYSADEFPPGLRPFTADEVRRLRDRHFANPASARRRVAAQLRALGFRPSAYTYGDDTSFHSRDDHAQ